MNLSVTQTMVVSAVLSTGEPPSEAEGMAKGQAPAPGIIRSLEPSPRHMRILARGAMLDMRTATPGTSLLLHRRAGAYVSRLSIDAHTSL
jgi:hypothetical protein